MIHVRFQDGRLRWLKTEAKGVVRNRRWKVTATWKTPAGPQKVTFKPNQKCRLADISALVNQQIQEDITRTGNVWDISWEAIGK